jgi:hypothetical protein
MLRLYLAPILLGSPRFFSLVPVVILGWIISSPISSGIQGIIKTPP